jgi:uncharacterized paraquat-inducible protein A
MQLQKGVTFMKYCAQCGSELSDDAVLCSKCGTPVGNKAEEPKKKGSSKAVAALVLSIVALVVSFLTMISFFAIDSIQTLILYSEFPIIVLAVIGIALAANTLATGKNGMAVASIVLSVVAIVCLFVPLFYMTWVLLLMNSINGGSHSSSSGALRMFLHF